MIIFSFPSSNLTLGKFQSFNLDFSIFGIDLLVLNTSRSLQFLSLCDCLSRCNLGLNVCIYSRLHCRIGVSSKNLDLSSSGPWSGLLWMFRWGPSWQNMADFNFIFKNFCLFGFWAIAEQSSIYSSENMRYGAEMTD